MSTDPAHRSSMHSPLTQSRPSVQRSPFGSLWTQSRFLQTWVSVQWLFVVQRMGRSPLASVHRKGSHVGVPGL